MIVVCVSVCVVCVVCVHVWCGEIGGMMMVVFVVLVVLSKTVGGADFGALMTEKSGCLRRW